MSPYRTRVRAERSAPRPQLGTSDLVLAWLMIFLGGGRVIQALWLRETWRAEATICLGVFSFGVLELVRTFRADRRSR